MFSKLLAHLFRPGVKASRSSETELDSRLEKAALLMQAGDKHGAVAALRSVLEVDPFCVMALNDLGACLADIGDNDGATAAFEQAFALDDTFLPAAVNHAKMLCDSRKSQEALPFLAHAKISNPEFAHVDGVYAGVCLHLGHLDAARHYQLRAWLANFDGLRVANGHLFYTSFQDGDPSALAAEHRFWAETLKPIELPAISLSSHEKALAEPPYLAASQPAPQRIRIGYWSPDFRSHSVRYFFRPLLEGHDRERFEVLIYHDVPKQDEQTHLIKQAASHFHDVCLLPDAELSTLIKSHRLDILVELAGHTSNNRVSLLTQRLARIQLTGLGYPPTTGLNSIDGKVMDRNVVGPNSMRHYTERPVVLPTSFWCFDPMEDSPLAESPPVIQNGYITFGCVGNIAKISDRMLANWKQVLESVPDSRLLLRAINFEDDAAIEATTVRLRHAGVDIDRVDLKKPEGGAAFFESYNEIDIVLDTFPFNGGTTTCFATYMGVPVISLFGESLISRMGLSILSSLGAAELAVSDESDYVRRAVALAKDTGFLLDFKRTARKRFKESCLGNGKLFALEFEQACISLLQQARPVLPRFDHGVPALPADELIRRAFFVMRRGQADAARRILAHCLDIYPDNGTAHVLVAQQLAGQHRVEEAISYLSERLENLRGSDHRAALICLARFHRLTDEVAQTISICSRLLASDIDDPVDLLQVELLRVCTEASVNPTARETAAMIPQQHIWIVIPCDSEDQFLAIEEQVRSTCPVPANWRLTFERSDEQRRIRSYRNALLKSGADIVVLMQKNIELHRPDFFVAITESLQGTDILGFAGAARWTRMDWRLDEFELKAAGYFITASEKASFVELQWLGLARKALVSGMSVLDGGLIAVSRTAAIARGVAELFDEALIGSEVLLEEGWTHASGKVGCRLAVHRNLGILIRSETNLDTRYQQSARIHQASKLGFDPFEILKDDRLLVSVPVSHQILPAIQGIANFIEGSA